MAICQIDYGALRDLSQVPHLSRLFPRELPESSGNLAELDLDRPEIDLIWTWVGAKSGGEFGLEFKSSNVWPTQKNAIADNGRGATLAA